MGLIELLGRAGSGRLHVLLVEGEDAFALRVAAEQACLARGWTLAGSPADADALLGCGHATATFAAASDAVFDQMPGPRARAEISSEGDLRSALDQLKERYLRWRPEAERVGRESQLSDPSGVGTGPANPDGAGGGSREQPHASADSDAEHGQMDHREMDHREMDHGQMDHGQMQMSGPGGIALASGDRGRDGLEMDRLQVRLGPVLPGWPAGLTLWCTLAGDVVTRVEVEQPGFRPCPPDDAARVALPVRLDAAAQLLDLAGAEALAARVRRTRDGALQAPGPAAWTAPVSALQRDVARSRMLRWSLRGLGVVSAPAVDENGWPSVWQGDVYARLLRLLDPAAAGAELLGPGEVSLALSSLLPGLELASARLVVASLAAPALDRAATPRVVVG